MPRMKVVIVGGGMAGMSCAAELAPHCDVTVFEAEDAPGYHSSGRSAASYIEPYINATIFALTTASRVFFERPPAGFADAPLVASRADVMIATAAKAPLIDVYLERWRALCPGLVEISAADALQRVPILRQRIGCARGVGSERAGHRRARLAERISPRAESPRRRARDAQPGGIVGACRRQLARRVRAASRCAATSSSMRPVRGAIRWPSWPVSPPLV